jgi:hypothetical protein
VGREFDVKGWAFKDGVGLARIEVLLDGKVVASAQYGRPYDGLQHDWAETNDPQHPNVGFSAHVDLRANDAAAGPHWLGLRLHGRDGSVEDWAEQPIEIGR